MKEEYMSFLAYVENLWKLKLLAIGAVVSFALLNNSIPVAGINIVVAGLLVIPILAFVIDLKILETALHLKNISLYLENNLSEVTIAKNWETQNWKTGFFRTNRTFLTFLSTIGISFIIHVFCLYIVAQIQPDWSRYCIIGGVVTFAIGGVLIFIFARALFRKGNSPPHEASND